jgi:hypothetical protein
MAARPIGPCVLLPQSCVSQAQFIAPSETQHCTSLRCVWGCPPSSLVSQPSTMSVEGSPVPSVRSGVGGPGPVPSLPATKHTPYSLGVRVANSEVHHDQRYVPRPRMRGMASNVCLLHRASGSLRTLPRVFHLVPGASFSISGRLVVFKNSDPCVVKKGVGVVPVVSSLLSLEVAELKGWEYDHLEMHLANQAKVGAPLLLCGSATLAQTESRGLGFNW